MDNKLKERRKSFNRPRLASIDELLPMDQQDPKSLKSLKLVSKCKICNVDNQHMLKHFICKSCKAMNFGS